MLPSQTARPAGSRSHMYRRGRSRRVPAIIAVAALVAGAVIFYKWQTSSGSNANASGGGSKPQDSSASLAGGHATPPAAKPAPIVKNEPPKVDPAKPAKPPEPVLEAPSNTIRMGAAPAVPQTSPTSDLKTDPKTDLKTDPATTAVAANAGKPETKTPSAPPVQPPLANNPPPSANTSKPAGQRLQIGLDLIAQNKPLEARKALTAALLSRGLSAADADRARQEMAKLNEQLVFGPQVAAGDPYAKWYTIAGGDSLAKLPKKLGLDVDWRFLQRINNISAPERIGVGQKVKVVTGPFSAVVTKSDYRMDLYMGTGGDRVYVRSFKVGLGSDNATPEGEYMVKPNSKLVNPAWNNPRTGEHFEPNDPKNPLGEYWIGLIGVSDNIRGLESYGVHGTIDPDSIGKMKSMGCIRMGDDDIKLVYELLVDSVSHVEVHGEDYP